MPDMSKIHYHDDSFHLPCKCARLEAILIPCWEQGCEEVFWTMNQARNHHLDRHGKPLPQREETLPSHIDSLISELTRLNGSDE